MNGWSQTTNLNLATALATCGVDFEFERLTDEATGTVRATFFLSLKSKTLGFSTPGILRQLRERKLEEADPTHPVLDALHALNTREHLLTWLNRGDRCKIVPIAGSNRAVTVAGSEASPPAGELVATPDIKLACALMRCGFPCVGIDGEGLKRRFLIRARGHFDGHGGTIAKGIRDGTLAKEQEDHPALWAMMALRNRDSMLSKIKHGASLILLRNPKSADWQKYCRSAVIFEGSTTKALDKVQRHLRISP